jgi:predicted transcriptional regulator
VIISGLEMKFDMSEKGLLTLFKPYQAALMEHIWEQNNPERTGITSGQGYEFLQGHPDSKSRAMVIFFLNEMVEEGVLEYEEESGKGGYHRVYYPKMNREQFARYVVETITDKLNEVFPEA